MKEAALFHGAGSRNNTRGGAYGFVEEVEEMIQNCNYWLCDNYSFEYITLKKWLIDSLPSDLKKP